jgi:DUF1365 family protein
VEAITVPYVVGRAARAAIYRTHITHLRQTPVNHYFEHRSYSWYVDIDELPRLPRWLRVFARFDPRDHFAGDDGESLRQRLDGFLARNDATVPGGRITALLQPRVLGHAFNPLTLYWCHDRHGVLRHVVAEVHNTHGERHAYLLPSAATPVLAAKRLYASPFHPLDGNYVVRAPRPDQTLDVDVSLYRGSEPAFIATMRGQRRPATITELLRLQLVAPAAPLQGRLAMRVQGVLLWLRGVPRVPWRPMAEVKPVTATPTVRIEVTDLQDASVAS